MAQPEIAPQVANAPAAHRSTWRASELLVQLAIVTAGVLIALSLESVVEWSQHRSLARQARVNIREEIRENGRRLDRFLEGSKKFSDERKELRKVINDLIAKKPESDREVSLNFNLTQLATSAWRTAGATGALGHMPYGEVQGYAQAYDVQASFEALQAEFLREFAHTTMHGLDSDEMTPEELQTWKGHLTAVESSIRLQESLARVIRRKIYPGVLEDLQPAATK